jgi:hypothetical protein
MAWPPASPCGRRDAPPRRLDSDITDLPRLSAAIGAVSPVEPNGNRQSMIGALLFFDDTPRLPVTPHAHTANPY